MSGKTFESEALKNWKAKPPVKTNGESCITTVKISIKDYTYLIDIQDWRGQEAFAKEKGIFIP